MEIKPLKIIPQISDIPESKVKAKKSGTPQPLKAPSGKWSYRSGTLFFQGRNVGDLLQDHQKQPAQYWSDLARNLDFFRQHYIQEFIRKRKKKIKSDDLEELDPEGELSLLSGLVDAYIEKIMRMLKRKYDETANGLSLSLDEYGQLVLNGTNVTAFLQMVRQYPNKKARIFLKGLKNRLNIILSNRQHSPVYEVLRDSVEEVIAAINAEIKRIN